nr:nucleotide-binding alpha-beta plait domain-containing protein [Tanacetum cinerariifolium]
MDSFHSKENDVSKISTSIFVTNFLENFSAKDLFHSCKVYGHVVDSFIPMKKTNGGKRFGFVRFINVFNVDRLVRFQRTPIHVKKSQEKSDVRSSNNGVKGHTTNNRSFAHVLKGEQQENTKVSDDSISCEHPPGFTPKEDDKELDHVDDNISEPKEDLQEDKDVNSTCSKLKSNSLNSGCSGHFKVSNVPKSGGSILNYMEELVKVGQTMGYKMEGCENDIMKIIEAQGDDSVHR